MKMFDWSKNVWNEEDFVGEECSDCGHLLTKENAITELLPGCDSPTSVEALADYCPNCAKKRGYKR